jgi:hypothetical protein
VNSFDNRTEAGLKILATDNRKGKPNVQSTTALAADCSAFADYHDLGQQYGCR